MLLSRFYKRKFAVLASVFVTTVGRLRWESNQVDSINKKLTDFLTNLRAQSKAMRERTVAEHNRQKAAFKKQQDEHAAHLKKAASDVKHVRSELMAEMSTVMVLRKQLEDLNAKLRREEALRDKHAAQAKAVGAHAAALGANVKILLVQVAQKQQQLNDALARERELNTLLASLNKQRTILRETLEALTATRAANERETERIQTSYNSMLNRYKQITASHQSITKVLQKEIDELRASIAIQAKRCVPDACGVCGGDESTCALLRSERTCTAAGDPHFATFDGAHFDFQVTGQFVLAKHGNPVNFEVQTMQRLAAGCPWQPRLNKGVAIRGGRNIVTMYTDWGTGVMLINGKKVNMPRGVWQRLGPGFTVYRAHDMHAVFRYSNSLNQVVTTTLDLTDWAYGRFTTVSITAPWQWSSGRSMWGLCGNYDNWEGDDWFFLSRNWQRLFYVTDSALDMFAHGEQRTSDIEMVEFSAADLALEKKLDKLNGVVPAENMVENLDETLMVPATTPDATNQDANQKAGLEKVSVALATPEMQAIARHRCRGSHGQTRKQCEVDILNGLPAAAARKTFDAINVEDKEKLLKRCMIVGPSNFAIIPAKRVEKREKKSEGYSYAMWYLPSRIASGRCVIAEKGSDFFITQNGANLDVGAGALHCTARDVLHGNKWTSVAISLHHSGSLQVYINGKAACAAQSKAALPKDSHNDLIVGGGAKNDACHGRVAHLYYMPQTVTDKEATIHSKISPFGCKGGLTAAAVAPKTAEIEEDNEDDSDLEDDE